MAEWSADDARWRLNADYPDDQRWVNAFERVKDDLDHALTELTETRLRAEVERAAWEGERRALTEALGKCDPLEYELKRNENGVCDAHCLVCGEFAPDGCIAHHTPDCLWQQAYAATARPTAPAVEG